MTDNFEYLKLFDPNVKPCEVDLQYCPFFIVFSNLSGTDAVEDEEVAVFLSRCCKNYDKYSVSQAIKCYMLYRKWITNKDEDCERLRNQILGSIPESFKKHLKKLEKFIKKNNLLPVSAIEDIDLYHIDFWHPCGMLTVTLWEGGWEVSREDGIEVVGDKVVCGGISKTTKEKIKELSKKLFKQ